MLWWRYYLWHMLKIFHLLNSQYVDEIVQSFNKCMNGHRSDIKCKLDLPLSRHILSYSHTEYRSFAKRANRVVVFAVDIARNMVYSCPFGTSVLFPCFCKSCSIYPHNLCIAQYLVCSWICQLSSKHILNFCKFHMETKYG
jgi:hypothetical protein